MTWEEIRSDPVLRDLPFKIESDRFERIVLMPPPGFWHGGRQMKIAGLLEKLMSGGMVVSECPIQTTDGVKAVDVAWLSRGRVPKSRSDSTVLQIAPEICVEVLSTSNSASEMEERRSLLFERGAQEVWICGLEGGMKFFNPAAPVSRSRLCPKFPSKIEV